MRGAWLLLLLLSTGCYPIYKQLQRDSSATVLDEKGAPLVGAEVSLISSTYPYGFESNRCILVTDASGLAQFEGKREWRWEAFFIHGAQEFFWNWCVEKEGYQTHQTAWTNAGAFVEEVTVSLTPGDSTPCARPPER